MVEMIFLTVCGLTPIILGIKLNKVKSNGDFLYKEKDLGRLPYIVKNELWKEETIKINKVIKSRNEYANFEGYSLLKKDIEEINEVLNKIEKEPKIVKYKYILNIKILLRKLYKSISNTDY